MELSKALLRPFQAPLKRLRPGRGPQGMPVHHKLVLLGAWLLLSCGIVAAMGIWGIKVIEGEQRQLTQREIPVLTQLLRTDVDLYEAQLGLERAAEAADPVARKAGLDFFAENVTESDDKFSTYKKLAAGVRSTEEADAVAAYEADRAQWLRSAQAVARSIAEAQPGALGRVSGETATARLAAPAAAPTLDATRPLFATTRDDLDRIVLGIYEPAIENSGNRLDSISNLTCWKLFGGALLAVVIGIVVTRGMAQVLHAQQQTAETMNATQTEQTRRQVFEARLSRGLEMAQDEDAALRLIEQAIAIAAPGVATEMLLADSSRAHLHQAATNGPRPAGSGCRVPKPSDCPAVRRGHRLNFESSAMFDACPHLKNRPSGNCSAVCIPLSIMGQTVGVLHATAPDGQLPPESQIQALEQVASKSGERVGLLRAFQRTQAQAASDSLTGLLNRRSLEEKVHELTLHGIPFAVAYGDLDHFKNLNDTHGHETGDKALRTFAQVLKSSIRPGDLPARWGGEEFVLVLPRASANEAVVVLQRVREALAVVLRDADTPAFTISFGVANTVEGTLFTDVLACADASLLRAKKEGRNRTIISTETLPVRLEAPLADDPLPLAR